MGTSTAILSHFSSINMLVFTPDSCLHRSMSGNWIIIHLAFNLQLPIFSPIRCAMYDMWIKEPSRMTTSIYMRILPHALKMTEKFDIFCHWTRIWTLHLSHSEFVQYSVCGCLTTCSCKEPHVSKQARGRSPIYQVFAFTIMWDILVGRAQSSILILLIIIINNEEIITK